MTLEFFVPGLPQPQGSKKGYVVRGHAVLVESATGLKPWRYAVSSVAKDAMRAQGVDGWWSGEALTITMLFRFPRPKSLPKRVTQKVTTPDVDKLARAIGDALTAVVYRDDSQITDAYLRKEFGVRPGVQIIVADTEEG